MSSTLRVTCLLAAAGLCAPAFAQDSVSNNGLGDALDPYANAQQCANYVADLSPIITSKGTVFGVAPILKSAQTDLAFFNNLISAQAISPDLRTGFPTPVASYSLWENDPGAGINPTGNDAPGSIAGPASTSQFAAGFADFGGNYEGVIGALVNYDPSNPNRLYVARRQGAVNGASIAQDLAQLGGLSLDAHGNTYYRADTGNNTPTSLYRTRLADRSCSIVNIINGTLGTASNATNVLLAPNATAHTTPNMLPQSLFGGNGLVATGSFNAEYVYGAGPTIATVAHLNAPATNQRGALGFSRYNLLSTGGAVASLGQLAQNAAGLTQLINVWTVNAAGTPLASFAFAPPASITDNETGVAVNAPSFELANYRSQTAFRGGVGQVALSTDQAGRGLIASTRAFVTGNNIPLNDIIVGRYNTSNPASVQWTLAAYIDPTNTNGGKPVCNADGNAIGRMEELFDLTGGSPVGPSMSSPGIDAAGNIWFIGVVGFFAGPVPVGQASGEAVVDFDSALIRAVYDPATFSYSLEEVLSLGNVVSGVNSGTDYQISFMGIADDNSVSSGTFFSGNVNELAWNNVNRANLDPADPQTNGGVVVNVEITYDSNGDGMFDPNLGDEEYNVLLYVGYYADGPDCPCDTDGNGMLTLDDIDGFIAGFFANTPAGDCNGDGLWTLDDIDCFTQCFLAGCN